MATSDFLGIEDHDVLKNVRESLPENIKKTQNVLTIKDDVLYAWDFRDNCILTLNVKAVRTGDCGDVTHQTLLPQYPPLFTPDCLVVNENNTLTAVFGPNGVLIIELPARCPPFGAFDHNKELIYCRSYSLHERILAFSDKLEVRQVKFHPGSVDDSHVVVLTSDNTLRLYNVENGVASSVGVYPIGIQPIGRFPTTNVFYLEALGNVAVDFDFAPPEQKNEKFAEPEVTSLSTATTRTVSNVGSARRDKIAARHQTINGAPRTRNPRNASSLEWPMFVLYGDGDVYVVVLELSAGIPATVKGPLPILPAGDDAYGRDSCSILCINSVPLIVCVANCKGTIYHFVVLPIEDDFHIEVETDRPYYMEKPNRALYIFESVELELGLSTTTSDVKYNCPIFLHKNLGKPGHYFATHATGVHSVNMPCEDNLRKFLGTSDDEEPAGDMFEETSTAEYLICTKTTSSETVNPVIGFTVHYDPFGIVVLLAKGQLVSLLLSTLLRLPGLDNLESHDLQTMDSPLKKMLSDPFDAIVQKILRQSTTQPILKMSSNVERNQQECYELLQRAAQIFRDEYFKNHSRAHEEIEKRVRTLKKLKDIQKTDLERMCKEKQNLQEKAEHLAEKYEDIKEKQEELTKRCEKLLISISKTQAEPSNAEKDFLEELRANEIKVEKFKNAIAKLRNKIQYQDVQMKNWNNENKKESILGSVQSEAIKSNLQEMNNKVTVMVKEVNEYTNQLNLK